MTRIATLLLATVATLAVAGCAAPCDQYCDNVGDYIETCLEVGTSGAWTTAAAGGGWTYWGASDKDQYVTDCKADLKSQVDASEDELLTGACEDDANLYLERNDRLQCADLP